MCTQHPSKYAIILKNGNAKKMPKNVLVKKNLLSCAYTWKQCFLYRCGATSSFPCISSFMRLSAREGDEYKCVCMAFPSTCTARFTNTSAGHTTGQFVLPLISWALISNNLPTQSERTSPNKTRSPNSHYSHRIKFIQNIWAANMPPLAISMTCGSGVASTLQPLCVAVVTYAVYLRRTSHFILLVFVIDRRCDRSSIIYMQVCVAKRHLHSYT